MPSHSPSVLGHVIVTSQDRFAAYIDRPFALIDSGTFTIQLMATMLEARRRHVIPSDTIINGEFWMDGVQSVFEVAAHRVRLHPRSRLRFDPHDIPGRSDSRDIINRLRHLYPQYIKARNES